METRPTPGPLTLEAVKAYKERNYNEALDRLQRAEEAGEARAPISTVRGGVLMAQSKFGEAAEFLKSAKESLPPEAFAGILQDPVFSPYRAKPELSGFFQAPQ